MSAPLGPDRPVGVIGAGAMGAGIALVAAAAGHPVRLYDAVEGAAERARLRLAEDLKRLVARGKLAQPQADERLARIVPVASIDGLAGAALVVEAIIEDMAVKSKVLGAVEARLAADAILATNTSSLSVTALAAGLARPERFLGMHFFNPAAAMPLVEVVSGAATDGDVAALVAATARAWGKTPVACGSTPGFIVNRVARPFYGETLRLLEDRAADPATIDALLRDCGGFRMGPCELMDLIGHDVNFAVTASVYAAFFQDPRYRPSLVQQALIEAGRLGRKTGHGFYPYGEGAPAPEPAAAPPGPRPQSVVVAGDLGPAAGLVARLEAAGIALAREERPGVLRLGRVDVALTDGRTATARTAESGRPTALVDLALDFGACPRAGVAVADQMSAEEAAGAYGLLQAAGYAVSPLDDVPGLAVARTVAMLINEAADAVQQGVASAEDVDLAMMKGAGYPLGPLAWCDRVGAGWAAGVIDALDKARPDGRYRTAAALRRRALAGGAFIGGPAA